MEKSYEKNPEIAMEKKRELQEMYPEIFEKYKINDLSQVEVCNLAEFLIAQNPDKYEKNRAAYENDENMQKVYAIVHRNVETNEREAVIINTSDKGKMPEGEFGVYNLDRNHFEMSGKVKNEIVKYLGIGGLSLSAQDKMINELFYKKLGLNELSIMDKLATMELKNIIHEKVPDNEVKKIRDKYINDENRKNGKSEEDREKIEERENNKKDELSKKELPKDVQEGMQKAKAGSVVRYFYVNANELGEKVEAAKVNKVGGKVLVMEVADSSRVSGPNRYFAFQDSRMVLWGNEDEEVKDVTGNVLKMGQVVKPLKKQKPEWIEYRDSYGTVVSEKIDDRWNLSEEEIEEFKEDVLKDLEQYSNEIGLILSHKTLSPEEMRKKLEEADENLDAKTNDSGVQNDVSLQDRESIASQTNPERLVEDDEPDAWEVPGKRER